MAHSDDLAQPDGFIGAILAVEGITDACTILNGPTGCKMHLGELSKDQFRRENDVDLLRYADEFFFRQDRVPCTYIDDYDYVFGTAEKLEYVFPRVAEKGYNFIAVLNSPGASLIGDDLQRYLDWSELEVPTTVIESPHYTSPFEDGWVAAAVQVVQTLCPVEQPAIKRVVNLVGLTIWQRHWAGSRAELVRLLKLCGVAVHATLLADCTVEDIRQLRRACCNVIVHEETGLPLAHYLKQAFGMPFVRSSAGAPIGWDAQEEWVRVVCGEAGADPTPALEELRRLREKTADKIYRYYMKTGLPRGAGFVVNLEASLALPLTRWLCDYLGMTPLAVQVSNPDHPLALRLGEYLSGIGAAQAWMAELDPVESPEAVFSNDAVILRLMDANRNLAGVDLAMPSKDVTQFHARSVLGPDGTLWLLEALFNGLWPKANAGIQ